MQQTLKVAHISQFSPIEGEFPSELHKTYDVGLCKIHKRMFQKVFFNDKHVNLSLLKDFNLFKSLKKTSFCWTREKKETQFVKMLQLLHLMTFDPIFKSTCEHLVIKTVSRCFLDL